MNDILDRKIADSPEPLTYAVGAVVEFKVLSYRLSTITGGALINLRLQPVEVKDWPDEEPDVSQLPLMTKTVFLMDNQPSALREFANDMETYAGIDQDDVETTRDLLDTLRGAALTLYVSRGPNERGDYTTYYRHNSD